MHSHFHGVIKEITENYPDITLTDYLAEELNLTLDKAEVLGLRVKKYYLEQSLKKEKHGRLFQNNDKNSKPMRYQLNKSSRSEFEYFVIWLLKELGYKIHEEINSTFWGADLLAEIDGEKLAICIIHCPETHCISDTLIPIIQNIKQSYAIEKMLTVATTFFSEETRKDAEPLNVTLWDADTISQKILEVKQKQDPELQESFPEYKGSLLKSIFALEENKTFIIVKKSDGKFDLNLPGIRYPLLTFREENGKVLQCVFRIKYNMPVSENEGITLIGFDENGKSVSLEGSQAYNEVIKYLKQFLD